MCADVQYAKRYTCAGPLPFSSTVAGKEHEEKGQEGGKRSSRYHRCFSLSLGGAFVSRSFPVPLLRALLVLAGTSFCEPRRQFFCPCCSRFVFVCAAGASSLPEDAALWEGGSCALHTQLRLPLLFFPFDTAPVLSTAHVAPLRVPKERVVEPHIHEAHRG